MTDTPPTNQQLDEYEAVFDAAAEAGAGVDVTTGRLLLAEVRRQRAELAGLEIESARWVNVRNLVEKAIDKGWSSVDTFDLEDALGPDTGTVPAGEPARLLDCGLCFEEQGEEVHPHPECLVGRTPPAVPAVVETGE